MKLRQVLSVVVVSLLPVFSGLTQGCVLDQDSQQTDNITQQSDYEMNIAAANEIWHSEVPIVKPADAWTALVKVGDQTIPAPTHLFGDVINIIPYSNEDGVKDAKGSVFKYGDQEIAKVFKPGDVGVAVKHHRPEHRLIDLNSADASAMKEDFKLQDTHIELVVGVEKAEHGKAGAITLNNPQSYEDGRFGNPQYSMVFLRPVYPSYAADRAEDYEANVLATLMMFNSVTSFPGDYNGGDPLGAHTPERLRTYVDNAVRAIAGDEEAKAWFEQPENLIYCAELAFISLSAGLHEPLTAENLVPRVGEEVWSKFVEQVEIHNRGVDEFQESGSISEENTSNFVRFNDNQRVAMVRIPVIEDLPSISQLSADAAGRMAFRPMTMADIVRQFMRTHIPRETLGEALAPVQGAVLAKMKPGLLESMAMDQLPATDPRRVAVEQLFDQIVEVVGTPYESYQAFLQALEPYMAQANGVAGPRPGDESGAGLFAPPSLMHVVAQGHHQGGLLGLQYEGHGVHVTAVQKKNAAEPEPEPTPVDDIADEVSCQAAANQSAENSCGMQAPGGCWCDDYCKEAGDCCADATEVCGY